MYWENVRRILQYFIILNQIIPNVLKFFVLASSLYLNFSSRERLFFSIPSILLYKYIIDKSIVIFSLYFVWKFGFYWLWNFFNDFLKIFIVVNSAKSHNIDFLKIYCLPKAFQIERKYLIKLPRVLVKCVFLYCHCLAG